MIPDNTRATLSNIATLLADHSRYTTVKFSTETAVISHTAQPWLPVKNNIATWCEQLLAKGHVYKDDTTSTVAATEYDNHGLVIKRYNHKGFLHSIRQRIGGSRAYRSFRDGILLRELGIATPEPLVYCVEYRNRLPARAYIVTEKSAGKTLHDLLLDGEITPQQWPAIVDKVTCLVNKLHSLGITHGDIKHTNLLYHQSGRLEIIDLDSLRIPKNQLSFEHFRQKDLKALNGRINSSPEDYIAYKKKVLGL